MMSPSPLLRWLGSSMVDTMGRLIVQVVSTAIFARLLLPEEFGMSALCMALVGIASAILTTPIEEALTQRRRVRSAHFGAALGLALLLASLLLALMWGLGRLDSIHALPLYSPMLGFSLILLAEGPATVFTALARRQRLFSLISWSNLAGISIGTFTGLLMAFMGAGLWSLIAVRVVSRFVNLAVLMYGVRIRPTINLSRKPLGELAHFTGWLMAGKLVDTVSDALVQSLVSTYFGLSANGYLNMAMRVVEPLRGAAGAIGHNLASSYFFRLQHDPARMGVAISTTISESAWILQPMFLGLAAIAPTTIMLISGPGWEPANNLAICLAIAAAISSLANFLHSGLSARSRNDLGLVSSVLDFCILTGLLLGWHNHGILTIGLIRIVTAISDLIFTLLATQKVLSLQIGTLLNKLWPPVITAAVMASIVSVTGLLLQPHLSVATLLVLQIAFGSALYLAAMLLLHRQQLHILMIRIRGKVIATPTEAPRIKH